MILPYFGVDAKKLNLLHILGGDTKWHSYLEKSVMVFHIGERILLHLSHFCIPKKNENWCSHKNLYLNVDSGIIHNFLKLETTQMSSLQLLDKIYDASNNGILFSSVIAITIIWMKLKYIMRSEIPNSKDHILTPFLWYSGDKILRNNRNQISGCQGCGLWEVETTKRHRRILVWFSSCVSGLWGQCL